MRHVAAAVEPYRFDAIHGAWWGRSITTDARVALQRSVERYIAALDGTYDNSQVANTFINCADDPDRPTAPPPATS